MADKVELSSIRVTAEIDASRYKQGAADIAAANKAISDTSKQTDTNVVSLQTKISQSGDALARLSRQYVDGYASAQRFNSALQQLSTGLERGRITIEQASPILDGIYRKYGLMGDAAQFAARGQAELASAVQAANAKLAQQHQQTSIETAARETAVLAARAAQLRAELNPAAAAFDRMNAEVAEYNELLQRSLITTEEFARAQQRAQQRHIGSQAGQGGQSRFGSMNAAAQFQDIAVTAQMGQSPLTIALQQGTQLGQALESGMKSGAGLRGVVTGLGTAFASMLSPVNLLAIGLTAVAAIAIQFFGRSEKGMKDLEDATKKTKTAADDLAKSYGVVGAALEKINLLGNESVARESERVLRRQLTEFNGLDKFRQGTVAPSWVPDWATGAWSGGGITSVFSKFQDPIDELKKGLAAGKPDFDHFELWVHNIAGTDPGKLRLWEDQLLALVDPARKAADELDRLHKIQQAIDREETRPGLAERRKTQGYVGGRDVQQQIADEQRLARIQQDRARTDAERLAAAERTSRAERPSQADIGGGADARARRAVADEQEKINEEIKEEIRLRQEARDELIATSRNELAAAGQTTLEAGRLRKEFELLYQAEVAAKNAGRQLSDAERDDIKRTAAEYAKLQVQIEAINAARERQISRQRSVDDAQHELEIIGRTAAETTYLNTVYEQQEALKEEAIRTGQSYADMLKKEGQAIEDNAKKLAALAEAQAKKRLQDDILFERRQIFRTPEDQEIAGRLRAAGLDENLNSAEAQMIRFNQQLERMKDTWQGIFDTVDDGIDSMVDALFDGTDSWEEELKKIGRQFARQMFDLALTNPLKNWLTGANTNTIADLGIFGSGASSGRGGGFGGVLGNLLGAQKAVSSMQVQAATVIVNGSIVPGIPGVTDVAAAAAAAGGGGGGGGGGSVLRHVGGAGSVSSNFDEVVTGSVKKVFDSAGSTKAGIPLSRVTSGDLTAQVSTQYAGRFQGLLDDLKAHGYPVKTLGGYNYRNVRGPFGTKNVLSRHAYGEAVDINAGENVYERGATGTFGRYGIDPNELARKHGLTWGGSWRTPDTMHFQVDKHIKATEEITVAATKAADSLTKVGLAGFESVKGLTDAAGGLTQFGSLLKNFMAPGGGSASGWFQNLTSLAGSAAGAVSGMQAISPGATQAIIAGGALGPKGLYHTGGIAGYPSSTRYVDDGVFMNARRYHGGGLAGDEVPAILRRGEPVFPSMAAARRMFANDRGYNANRNEAPIVNLKNINVFDPSVVGDYTRTDSGEQAMINMMRRTGSARGL